MIDETVRKARELFATGATRSLEFRRDQLRALRSVLTDHEASLLEALHEDLGKPHLEAYASEIHPVRSEIDHALKHLHRWMRPRKARTPLGLLPGRSRIHPEPLGIVLIFGPWNFPVQLVLWPLVGALAAGNCAILKPSEFTPNVSAALGRIIGEVFPPEVVSVVEGGPDTARRLLDQPIDHVFFTGSTGVGQQVMEGAARRLIPVTLELGGKTPCIVWKDVDCAAAARRILWGKTLNCGQSCVAPDYVLVHGSIRDPFVDASRKILETFFSGDARKSPDYGRIVNEGHWDRLAGYLEDGEIILGGDRSREDLYLGPTLMIVEDPSAAVLQEEIFGPILPILPVDTIEEAIRFVRERPKPLALYLFTHDADIRRQVLRKTSSGGVCINDTVNHLVPHGLPFGGVGDSGFGRYHGRAGFDALSNMKSVLRRGFAFDSKLRYPPYSIGLGSFRRALRWLFR